ncbi:MAG: DNA-binding response regulator, partial [Thermoflexia bacterium]
AAQQTLRLINREEELAVLQEAICQPGTDTRVVILTVSEDDQDFLAAIRHGADGYLVKSIRPEALFQELRGLAQGEAPISREMASKLIRQMARRERMTISAGLPETLSAREREVLALLAEGLSNEEIAEELHIAVNTVRNHVRNILEKLGVRNRVQAAVYAVRCSLMDRQ